MLHWVSRICQVKRKRVLFQSNNCSILLGYQADNNPYMGATVGRVTNRITNAQFTLDGRVYRVATHNQAYSLHGGIINFSKVNILNTLKNKNNVKKK